MKYLLDKDSLEKLAIEVFGEERVYVTKQIQEREIENPDWDYDEYSKDPDNYDESEYIIKEMLVINIYVHFPSLVITNSKGYEHPILDLFVKFTITNINPNNDYRCDVYIEGTRSTFSLKEMCNAYVHSHLLGGSYSFHQFCLGSSSYGMLLTDVRMNPTEETWLMIFMGLENYVSWESLEGGPYRKIHEMTLPNRNVNSSMLTQELRKIIPYLPKQVWGFNGKLELIENHPLLFECFNKYSTIRKMHSLSDKEAKRMINDWMSDYGHCNIFWKDGKRFPFKIIYEPSDDNPQIDREIVNQYIQIIKQQLEEYNKNLSYERAKEIWHPKTVAKAGII
jgi:hypothetical protein